MSKALSRPAAPSNATRAPSRRDFLKQAAAAGGAAAVLAPTFWRPVRGQESANDRLTVGAIGTSIYTNRYTGQGEFPGRGAEVGHQAGKLGNMVAVADVNLRHARFFAKDYDGKCEVYQDYRQLLDRKDIDVVTIGTPDHWHSRIAIDAMLAGKDVYCEKPLTLTIKEGQQIIKVVEQTGRVFQVGTQQRSEYNSAFLQAIAIARSGRLGKKLDALVSVGKGETGGPFETSDPPPDLNWEMWLGQAPLVPYTKQRADFDFRWWLEYSGGQVTDWGVHHMDIALWALGKELTGPVEIEGKGNYPKIDNGFNVAVDFDCKYRFADGMTARLYSGTNELILSGENGRIRVNRGGLTGKPVEEMTEADKQWLHDEVVKLYGGKEPTAHMQNFFDCVKSRGKPVSDVWTHHRTVSMCHLANIAMILDRKLTWDPAKEVFAGDDQANAMRTREQRDPWKIEV